jgi:hypothetical protein
MSSDSDESIDLDDYRYETSSTNLAIADGKDREIVELQAGMAALNAELKVTTGRNKTLVEKISLLEAKLAAKEANIVVLFDGK